jgi:hypothetical protein
MQPTARRALPRRSIHRLSPGSAPALESQIDSPVSGPSPEVRRRRYQAAEMTFLLNRIPDQAHHLNGGG